MTCNTKKRLFHILNERAKKENREREEREEEVYNSMVRDPRRNHNQSGRYDITQMRPLIEEDE